METVLDVAKRFAIKGDIIEIKPIGNGHINKTYKVITTASKYVLQRINTNVFPNVSALMNNLVRVTEHLKDENIFSLRFIPTYDGAIYYQDENGCYRIYKYIENSICYEGIDDLKIVEKTGFAFGQLHGHLSDINSKDLVEVIPGFHDTKKRYNALLASIALDPVNRAMGVKEEIDFVTKNAFNLSLITDALENGEIHSGVIHNDPKINNVLFNRDNGEVRCVIDLDTLMPGSFLFDFGDALRSLFTGKNEDTDNLDLLKVDLDVYKAYLKGYYSQMKSVLNKKEIELLPASVFILTIELVIRFLKDYIDGDVYFAIDRPDHNLVRARTQIALAKDIIAHYDDLVKITNEVCR